MTRTMDATRFGAVTLDHRIAIKPHDRILSDILYVLHNGGIPYNQATVGIQNSHTRSLADLR